jgi:hypothetical protein
MDIGTLRRWRGGEERGRTMEVSNYGLASTTVYACPDLSAGSLSLGAVWTCIYCGGQGVENGSHTADFDTKAAKDMAIYLK